MKKYSVLFESGRYRFSLMIAIPVCVAMVTYYQQSRASIVFSVMTIFIGILIAGYINSRWPTYLEIDIGDEGVRIFGEYYAFSSITNIVPTSNCDALWISVGNHQFEEVIAIFSRAERENIVTSILEAYAAHSKNS